MQTSRKCSEMSGDERGFVIDTNVIVGAFFYKRNYPQIRNKQAVLRKCRLILDLVKGKNVAIPRVAVVEVISVVKRISGDTSLAIRLGNAVETSFEVVSEEEIYGIAKETASFVAPSGFDTYFLALALMKGYSLITRDKALCSHSKDLNVPCLLIDESTDDKMIKEFLEV